MPNWAAVIVALSRSGVELGFDGLYLVVGYGLEVSPLREVLPDEAIQVLIRSSLPAMVGSGKVKI